MERVDGVVVGTDGEEVQLKRILKKYDGHFFFPSWMNRFQKEGILLGDLSLEEVIEEHFWKTRFIFDPSEEQFCKFCKTWRPCTPQFWRPARSEKCRLCQEKYLEQRRKLYRKRRARLWDEEPVGTVWKGKKVARRKKKKKPPRRVIVDHRTVFRKVATKTKPILRGPVLIGPGRVLYSHYTRTQHWETLRQRALERAGRKCQVCSSTDHLQVHHNTYARVGNERLTDLFVLCNGHHQSVHEDSRTPQIPIFFMEQHYVDIPKRLRMA